MSPASRRRRLATVIVALAALAAAALTGVLGSDDKPARAQGPSADARPSTLRPGVTLRPARTPVAVREARRDLARRLGSQGLVQTDRRTGGVRQLARLDGYLTGPGAGSAADRTLGYVRSHRRVFGLDAGDLRGLRLVDTERDPGGRVTRVRWQQRAGGIVFLDGDLRATVATDGRILSIGGGARPDLDRDATTRPGIDARRAREIAARATGATGAQPAVRSAKTSGDRATRFADDDEATLVHTAATGELRLAWRVIREQSHEELYDQLVDARTGQEIRRLQRITHASGHAFDNHPGAPQGGTGRLVSFDADLNPGAADLSGPAARVFTDVDDDGIVDPGEAVPPKTGGNWDYPRRPVSGGFSTCPAVVGCSWTPETPGSWRTNREQAGTQLFHFLRTFRRHLAADPIGFDGFAGVDRVDGRALDGADGPGGLPIDLGHLNNASMEVRPEGHNPTMRMYLWAGKARPVPAVSSADDAAIVYHEYTHGLVGRLVTDPTGWSALGLRQPAAMNEGLSDFYALDYLVGTGLESDGPPTGEVRIAKFVDPHNAQEGRTEGFDCPVGAGPPACPGSAGAGAGGYTYADFAKIDGKHEVHADGEIVVQTLWDLRARMIADHGQAEGLRRLRSMLTSALRQVPIDPSFLDLRNGLLLAAVAPGAEGDAQRIWEVFAKRGMGYFASTVDGDDATPHEDLTLPPGAAGGAVTGTVTDDATGDPLAGAVVALGGHDTGELFPADLRATSDADGRFRITGVPAGTYKHLILTRHGYETKIARDVAVGAGDAVQNLSARRNWADLRAGAELTLTDGDEFAARGCGANRSFDGDRTLGWATLANRPHSLELRLPADLTVTSVALDPTARCDTEQAGAAGQVTVEVGGASGPWAPGVVFRLGSGSVRNLTEVRPSAPLEDVRRIRVTLHGPVDPQSAYVAVSELMVFAARKAPPRAAFEWEPRLPDVDEEITFDAAGSRPGSTPIVRHEWDLDGDGSYEHDTGTTTAAKRTFDEGGRHTVGLKVTDEDGQTDETRRQVSIGTGVEIFDLGTLEPGETGTARAVGITERGVIHGQTHPPGVIQRKAYRYRGGDMEELPRLPGHDFGAAGHGTDNGLAVGTSGLVTGSKLSETAAVLWNGTEPSNLGSFGGRYSEGRDVNESGTAVGWSQDGDDHVRPFIKLPGAPLQDVEELAGVPEDERDRHVHAWRINRHGVVIGCREASINDTCGGDAFRYDHAMGTLQVLPDLGRYASPNGLNDAGVITGWAVDATNTLKPVRWTPAGVLEPLGTLGGAEGSGISVSTDGTIVGVSDTLLGTEHAVRWQPGEVQPEDLNELVKGAGWELATAQNINDRDEIVGWGSNPDGAERAFQLSLGPCRLCVEDVTLEERDVAGGEWQPVDADGTVDGNRVRARVKVRNDDEQAHVAQVRGIDENRDEPIEGSGEPVSLSPGESDEVTLHFDTEGRAWNESGEPDSDHVLRFRATLGHTVFNTRGAAIKVRPKPVVLVHGALATAASWEGYAGFLHGAHPDARAYAAGDGQAPGTLDTGSFARLAASTASIAQNARTLAGYVAGVRRNEDAARVDVVAHGAGGLIGRRYVQDEMPEPLDSSSSRPVVDHLIQLGSPNRGSPCANLTGLAAQHEARSETAALFNLQVNDRRDVRFSTYAGDSQANTCASLENGDSVVPVSSALWEIADSAQGGVLHGELPRSGSVFTSFVKRRLSGEVDVPVEPSNGLRAAAEPEPVHPQSHELLARRTLEVAPGSGAETTLAVDSGGRLEVTLLAAPEVAAELVDPDGDVVARSEAGTRAARALFRTLVAESPAAGAWKVRLMTQGTEPTQAQATARLIDDRWQLDLRAGRAAAGAGTPLVATVVRDGRRLSGATVTVAARRPGAPDVDVALHDDGAHGDGLPNDGCYAASAALPAGDALLTMKAASGSGERLRETWADIAAPAGDGLAVVCPRGTGRNGEIAFMSTTPGGFLETPHRVDPAGVVTAFAGLDQHDEGLTYSPDGERVAYARAGEITVAAADGSGPRKVADGRDPAWSPDGARLVYTRCEVVGGADRCALTVLDLGAGTQRRIAESETSDTQAPTWSPDGERIAYVATTGESCGNCAPQTDLFRIGVDGSGLKRLTSGEGGARDPAWSPDGERIAFERWDTWGEATTAPDSEIYTVAPDGTGLANVTDDPDCDTGEEECAGDDLDTAAAWSPDGRRIAFVSNRGEPFTDNPSEETAQIWTIRPDGSGAARITSTPTDKLGSTSWRSLPYLETAARPDCRDLGIRTQVDRPVEIPLDCTDANGDALTLRVTDDPDHGGLSPIGAGGGVTYTPAGGFEGADAFTYEASDGQDPSAPATVSISVAPPPPPPPPPAPEPPPPPPGGFFGGTSTGGSSGGGGSGGGSGGGGGGGPRTPRLPADCNIDPNTGFCIVTVPCDPRPGSDRSGCTGLFAEAPAPRRRARAGSVSAVEAAVTSRRRRSRKVVLGRTTFRVPAGQTAQVRLRLTRHGMARLRRERRLRVRVAFRLRDGGRIVHREVRVVTFRLGRPQGGGGAARAAEPPATTSGPGRETPTPAVAAPVPATPPAGEPAPAEPTG